MVRSQRYLALGRHVYSRDRAKIDSFFILCRAHHLSLEICMQLQMKLKPGSRKQNEIPLFLCFCNIIDCKPR